MGTVVMYASVSVDGFIADDDDQPGPLFDWLTSGDVPLDDSGVLKVSQTSYDYVRPYWDSIGATIARNRRGLKRVGRVLFYPVRRRASWSWLPRSWRWRRWPPAA